MTTDETATGAETTEPRVDGDPGRSVDDPGRSGSGADARVYRVLGEQFLERPDRERVDAVGIWASEWRCNAEQLPLAVEAALERIEDGAQADLERLRTAYTNLFRGVSEQAPDPPYESLYVDGQFYSGTTTEVRKGYRWAGVDVDDARGNEPPDHLGLELQFLGELVARSGLEDAPDEPDIEEAQWWLLDGHLGTWLPSYHARIQQEDPPDYYGGLLDLALALVDAHRDALAGER